jgi:adenylate kinase
MSQRFSSLLLFGPPGSGKGTQGETLGHLPGFFHCSSGDVFRNLDKQSELGQLFLSFSTKGQLVPDDVTIRIWEDHMAKQIEASHYKPETDVLILDGLPRTVKQAEILDDKINVVKVLALVAPDEQALVQRLKKRAEVSGRPDDADEAVIANRLKVYHDETKPVLDHYQASQIAEIDAMGTPVEVMKRVAEAVIAATA